MDTVRISDGPLDVTDVSRSVTCPAAGAVVLFIGTTRDNCDGKRVIRLEYEAYESMAQRHLARICGKIREQWGVEHIAIIHRVGVVPVTEASVIIAVSSAHRQEALQAVQYAIDSLKSTVPIWKKEFYEEGTSAWKENAECAWKTK